MSCASVPCVPLRGIAWGWVDFSAWMALLGFGAVDGVEPMAEQTPGGDACDEGSAPGGLTEHRVSAFDHNVRDA
jgi:hypothetical protein